MAWEVSAKQKVLCWIRTSPIRQAITGVRPHQLTDLKQSVSCCIDSKQETMRFFTSLRAVSLLLENPWRLEACEQGANLVRA